MVKSGRNSFIAEEVVFIHAACDGSSAHPHPLACALLTTLRPGIAFLKAGLWLAGMLAGKVAMLRVIHG